MISLFRPTLLAALLATTAATTSLLGADIVFAQAATTDDPPTADDPPTDDATSAASDVDRQQIIRNAADVSLDEFLWIKRPVIVFANNAADPRFVQQMELISERLDVLAERDVVVITDTDPSARSDVRQTLRARSFMLVIMAKDGTIVARKPAPLDVRDISRSIDKLPLRQQEIRDGHGSLQD